MKLRNLILSLFLAAGAAAFTACDGTTGPAGVAGGAGAAGPAGPAGDAGKAGDSADEVMRSYAYLKVWGKPEGKAACSDPAFKSMDAFPGPATLPKLTSSTTPAERTKSTVVILLGGSDTADPAMANAAQNPTAGKCSNAVFETAPPPVIVFETLSNGTTDSSPMTETPRKGTTPTLRNATLTEIKKEFREGVIIVNFNPNGSEYGGRDLLFTRCDIGRTPFGGLRGTYRAIKITEDEYLLKTDAQGTTAKDTTTAGSKVTKTTSKICVRFSAPGTVKCYITETVQKRRTSDDKDAGRSEDVTTEQIVLYKDGKMTPVDPMPNKMNAVPGINTPALGTKRPFGGTPNPAGGARIPFITFYPNKLCNFFAGGVIGTAGAAAAAPSTGGGGQTDQQKCESAGEQNVPAGTWTSGACQCPRGEGGRGNSRLNPTTKRCGCASGSWQIGRDRDGNIVSRGC